MVLFGSRGMTVSLYALAVILVLFLGDCVFRFLLGRSMKKSAAALWLLTAALTVTAEILYSELEFWRHHNGMAGVWVYLGLPFAAGLFCCVLSAWIGRGRK